MTIAPGLVLPESEVAAICRRYQVKELALFGSAARGELRPDSDIDLLVEFLPGAEVDLIEHLAAERELAELLGRKVDLVSKRALRSALREEVLSQACHIYARKRSRQGTPPHDGQRIAAARQSVCPEILHPAELALKPTEPQDYGTTGLRDRVDSN